MFFFDFSFQSAYQGTMFLKRAYKKRNNASVVALMELDLDAIFNRSYAQITTFVIVFDMWGD